MHNQPSTDGATTPEQARQRGARYIEAWNSHDADRVLALVTDDVTWRDPSTPTGVLHGKAAARSWIESLWRAMPDLEFEMLDEPLVSIDGRRAAGAWRCAGTQTGPLDPPGYAPTDGHIELTGVDVHEFDGELIRSIWTWTDMTAIARQIGALPAPGSLGERIGVVLQRLAARRLKRAHTQASKPGAPLRS